MANNQKIDKIKQTLERIAVAINSDSGLQDFDKIEIPFQLTQACMELWTDCFSIPMLQNLANDDPETLEAWAIGLNSTLQVQLGILNQWMPFLSTSLPPNLRQRAEKRTAELEQLAKEKFALLQAVPNLLERETELHKQGAELDALRAKVNELQTIEAEVSATDLPSLRAEVDRKERDLLPAKETIVQLQQQKADLETEIGFLHIQQQSLKREIESQEERKLRQELDVMSPISKLCDLTETAKAKLSNSLAEALKNIDCQRDEYNQQWQQLQEVINSYNRYQTETEAIREDLDLHYKIDVDLGRHLPINHSRIEMLRKTIQEQLDEFDRELQAAHTRHELSQQKQYITFRTQP
ncbi:MAG: hypothetical protein EBE86_013385 [Hormoscilla sp. GUM202]|nr:hypothetical protein [Hormoscilla sp. GUM202]